MENNQNRLKIEVYQGLPIIQEMIKDLAITKEMGQSSNWINQRQFKRMTRNFTFEFTPNDVAKLNAALWRIGERLGGVRIEYSEIRQDVIDQIKALSADIWLPYIYDKKIVVKKCWWDNRMKRTEAKGTKANFTMEDVLKINLAVAEIAARLLSIELYVAENN